MSPYIYALGAILCWASLPAAIGSGLKGLTIEELMFYSFTGAAVFLYCQDVLIEKTFRLYVPGVKKSLVGVWGIFGYHYVYYTAMDSAPLAEAAILATTWSFWIVVFYSVIAYKTLKLSIVITALLGLTGVSLVISSGQVLQFNTAYLKGYLLALSCGLIWSSFSVALPFLETKRNPMTIFTIYAAALSSVLFFITGPHQMPPARTLASVLYLGFVPLGLSFFLWNKAITRGNLSVIGLLSYLVPPLAVLLVALIHRQQVSGQIIAGMGIIIAASVLGKVVISLTSRAD